MPVSNEKLVATNTFIDGISTVLAEELTPPTTARYILNCNILSQGAGSVGIITNVKGNKLISTPLPPGQNKCIGTASDEEANKFYFFVWNENGRHTIQQFDALSKTITTALENLTDTGNMDIMNLDKDYLILHADVVRNNLLYWVDGLNPARKTNISKLFDNSEAGYGPTILQSFIDAYKQTTPLAPTAVYFSNVDKPFNRLYGALRKFAIRLIYDDGEKSNVSDFSAVPLPSFEPFTGINTIPTDNNGINVTMSTGDRTVKQIEILMQSTSAEVNNLSILNWVSVIVLDKKKLGISDNSQYTYSFYNDDTYIVVDQLKVIRPYSFIPKRPRCQSFVKNALVYTNAYEGFPTVDIDVSASIRYDDLFIDPGTENEFNKPQFTIVSNDSDFVRSGINFTYYDGTVMDMRPSGAPSRFTRHTITIGADVKEGNNFQLNLTNGVAADTFNLGTVATLTDSALTIANKLKSQLIATGRIYRKTPDIPDSNIYDNTIVGGSVSFSYIIKANKHNNYINGYSSVNPVQFDTLKDTGQSVRNIKLGSSIKLGIMYEDFDGRKSLTYTVDALIIGIKTINELILDDGKTMYQSPVITLQINHKAPIWAKYYQIVRSNDLTYGKYIQMLIQTVVDINDDDAQDYLDLVVGSLFTYQKIHPNTPLTYEFSKGDRLRLLKNTETNTYYPFFETEIIAYNPTVTQNIQSNVTTTGDAIVTVSEASADNIGKIILINGYEREIVDAPSGTTYLLNNVIGGTNPVTYLNYDLIDRRGTIRIRKPNGITIEDNSTVELYKPSNLSNPLGSTQFFEFQKKFVIINAGTEEAYHTGTTQDQTATLPALVEISEGTAYVRNREMPVNNAFPGTQLIVETVEDPSYSDFYPSLINDNGRINAEDTGDGEVHFGSRMRYSNNFVEDTRINGLNDFDNTDREDYNDQYGDFMLTKFDTNRIFAFKQLKTTFVPVDSRITQDNDGVALNVSSSKLLNPIQYFAWEGGIGNNPESYASNGTQKYFVSANSGVIIRLGGNGEEPISKTYALDNVVKELLNEAINNKAKIFGGFDRKNGVYIITIEGFEKYIYFNGFSAWIVDDLPVPNDTIFELLTQPEHGVATLTSGFEITYQPDEDYVGHDDFTYRAFVNGEWSDPKEACIDITDTPQQTGWRQKAGSEVCVLDQYGLQNGFQGWATLEEFYIFTGLPTGVEKPNVDTDPNYVMPIYNPEDCIPVEPDPVPDAYSLAPVVDAEISTIYTSEIITPTGYNIPSPISMADGDYRINGGPWVSANGVMNPGDTLQVRRMSSPSFETMVSATPTLGGVSASFNITTKEQILEFESFVVGGAPERGITGNDGGVFPSNAPYQWSGSLANNTVILNTMPGIIIKGWLDNNINILDVDVAGNYSVKLVGVGSITFYTDNGQSFNGFADFFVQVKGVNYPLSTMKPALTGFTFPYQYHAADGGGSSSHKEATVSFSFNYTNTFTGLLPGDIIALYVSPRFSAVTGIAGNFRFNNTSLSIELKKV